MGKEDKVFLERLERHHDELRWLYMELYDNDSMFAELSDNVCNCSYFLLVIINL